MVVARVVDVSVHVVVDRYIDGHCCSDGIIINSYVDGSGCGGGSLLIKICCTYNEQLSTCHFTINNQLCSIPKRHQS